MIKKRYGLIIFSIHVWFYQIHLSLLFLLSFYHIEIRYFHKKVLPTSVQQCSKCVQEREGSTANKRQAANNKHQEQWHPKSNSHAQGSHCSCCYWRVNFTVTLCCCCCLQQKQFPERARRVASHSKIFDVIVGVVGVVSGRDGHRLWPFGRARLARFASIF